MWPRHWPRICLRSHLQTNYVTHSSVQYRFSTELDHLSNTFSLMIPYNKIWSTAYCLPPKNILTFSKGFGFNMCDLQNITTITTRTIKNQNNCTLWINTKKGINTEFVICTIIFHHLPSPPFLIKNCSYQKMYFAKNCF